MWAFAFVYRLCIVFGLFGCVGLCSTNNGTIEMSEGSKGFVRETYRTGGTKRKIGYFGSIKTRYDAESQPNKSLNCTFNSATKCYASADD